MTDSNYDHDLLLQAKRIAPSRQNKDLKDLNHSQGLRVSGNKTELSARILERLAELHDQGETDAFRALAGQITGHPTPYRPSHQVYRSERHDSMVASKNANYGPNSSYLPPMNSPQNYYNLNAASSSVTFPNTAFHEIIESLTGNQELPVIHQNRYKVETSFTLGLPRSTRMGNDKSIRILVYCTNEINFGAPRPDIAFPSQIELRVNNETFQGNLRGIKKKAGTTRPADITPFVHKGPGAHNQVSINYAATTERFVFVVNLVKKNTVESLVAKIKSGNTIPKQSVINDMISKANDSDVVATSTVMSLKCPLSAMRMSLPCRSTICAHNQCFDAESFLQLQEQAPQWSCPICNKVFDFAALAVDQYVQDILQRYPTSTDQVTIEPDGTVHMGDSTQGSNGAHPNGQSNKRPYNDYEHNDNDDDEDIVEISESRTNSTNHTSNHLQLPSRSSQSRQPSTAASAPSSASGTKRKQVEVVDLTLSSDDEDDGEPPRRPVKRQSTGGFNSSLNSSFPTLGPQQASSSASSPYSFNSPPIFPSYGGTAAFAVPGTPRMILNPPPSNSSMNQPSMNSPFGQYAQHNWGGMG